MKPERQPKERQPVQFKQLCAVARQLLANTPTMSDSDWAEAIKRRVLDLEYTYPEDPEAITRAMQQVEAAMTRTMGSRPVETPPAFPAPQRPPQAPPVLSRGLPQPDMWKILASLMPRLAPSVSAPSSVRLRLPTARETLDIDEATALDQFWAVASRSHPGSRLAVLKAFAEIAIRRPADWDADAIRASSRNHRLSAEGCFVCRSSARALDWHHVIQIQHGGSNAPRNRVCLCVACHGDIHPWIGDNARVNRQDWIAIGDLIPALRARLKISKGAA